MTRPRFVLATTNPHKVGEIAAILGPTVDLVDRPDYLGDVVEDGQTLEANARLKAMAVCAVTGEPALADDSGLEVDALDGAPGVHSARYAGDEADDAANVALLLRSLAGVPEHRRGARLRTVALAHFPDGSEVVAHGVVEGRIATSARGDQGFGYDPVFIPGDGDGRTFGEMAAAEKHALSHRGLAFRALVDLI